MPPLHTHNTNHEINRPPRDIQVTRDDYHTTTMDENGRLDDINTSILPIKKNNK